MSHSYHPPSRVLVIRPSWSCPPQLPPLYWPLEWNRWDRFISILLATRDVCKDLLQCNPFVCGTIMWSKAVRVRGWGHFFGEISQEIKPMEHRWWRNFTVICCQMTPFFNNDLPMNGIYLSLVLKKLNMPGDMYFPWSIYRPNASIIWTQNIEVKRPKLNNTDNGNIQWWW